MTKPCSQAGGGGAGASGGREITASAATLLLLAWTPRWRGPLPRGADSGDLEAAFPGCEIADEGPSGSARRLPCKR